MEDFIPNWFDEAEEYYKRGRYQDCINVLIKIIDSIEATKLDKAKAYFWKGNLYRQLKQYENAITDFTKAIKLATNKNTEANAYFNRGIAYKQLEQEKKAIADYKKSIKLACQYSKVNYVKPEAFYKFCPLNKHTFDMLKEQKLYFSDITSLNDPLECPFVQEDQFFHNTVFAEGTDYEPRIFSLVLPCDNQEKLPVKNYLLFFSHYAAAHTGICIEYKINKEFLHENMFYAKVSYQETKSAQSIPDLFAVKNKQWEYEREARFVAFGKKCTYSTKPGVTIKKIFFGLNTSKQNKDRLYKIMKKQKNIEFFEAKEAGEALLNVKFRPYPKEENQK